MLVIMLRLRYRNYFLSFIGFHNLIFILQKVMKLTLYEISLFFFRDSWNRQLFIIDIFGSQILRLRYRN